jgi:hypothetical protein
MKTKKEIIEYMNVTKGATLTNSNTSYSKINKSKAVWWFNVALHKFTEDVNLLLVGETCVYWIVLPKGFAVGVPFKIREDKNAVDLEINADSNNFLCDVKSGGTGFRFSEFVKEEIYLNK